MDFLEKNLLNEDITFGSYLRTVRESRAAGKISIRELARRVEKTPTYISDIEKGNNRPPDEQLLSAIISALELHDAADTIKNNLFDLAAKERGDVSADIARFIMNDIELRTAIRMMQTDGKKREDLLNILK